MVTYELFEGVPAGAAADIVAALPPHELAPGAYVTREGTMNGRLFLVERGSLAVWKGPPASADGVQLARIGPGGCLGEMAVVRPAPSSVSVVAATDVQLREVELAELPAAGGVKQRVALNLARIAARRLRQTETALRTAHDEQRKLRQFVGPAAAYLNWNLIGLAACMFSLPLTASARLVPAVRAGLSAAFIVFLAVGAWVFVRRNGVQRTLLGFDPRRWPQQALSGLAWSAAPIAGCVVVKAAAVYVFGWAGHLWEPMALPAAYGHATSAGWIVLALAAAALGAVTEFLRCGVHGSLNFFFQIAGRDAEWASIVVAAILCAALEVHVGVAFAWLNLALGLFWGSLFAWRRSFFATATCHASVALVVGFVLGFP